VLMRPDAQRGRSRSSVRLLGSLAFHVVVVAALLYWATSARVANPVDAQRTANRATPHLSPPPARPGQSPPEDLLAWPVKQAERIGLRLAAGHVIDHVWQSTLFAIGIALLIRACRRNRAGVRYALWFSASVKFLVPFSLVAWLGSFMRSSESGTFDGASMGRFVQGLAAHPLIDGLGQSLAPMGTAALWPSSFTVWEVTLTWVSLALLAIWTCGFAVVVASRIRRSRQHWDLVLTARRVELLDLKVPARLQVGLADGLLEPAVIGWIRPVLLFPADIEHHLTRPEIEAIVAHELCHVRRLDNLTAATHMAVEAIFWFHPLVWWLGTRLVDERERACDEYVLRTVEAPGPYAQGILSICERYVESPLASISGVRSTNLRQRIDAILANRIGENPSVWKKLMLSAIITGVVLVPLAAGAMQTAPTSHDSRRDRSRLGTPSVREAPARPR
jgi:bla regulator protein blaR1